MNLFDVVHVRSCSYYTTCQITYMYSLTHLKDLTLKYFLFLLITSWTSITISTRIKKSYDSDSDKDNCMTCVRSSENFKNGREISKTVI